MSKDKPLARAEDVMESLRKKYAPPGFALFEQVSNATGWRGGAVYGDAVVVSLWPSRGLEAYGFEVKVSRNDWRKELANPKKAEMLQRYCDRWWIVSANKCVPKEEVPKKWGLLELRGKSLHTVKPAPSLKPKAWDKEFLAALMRRGSENLVKVRQTAYAEGMAAGEKQGPVEHQLELGRAQDQLRSLQNAVEAFERASGVTIGSAWRSGQIGKAVELILNLHGSPRLEESATLLDRAAEQLTELAEVAKREAIKHRQLDRTVQNAVPNQEESTDGPCRKE